MKEKQRLKAITSNVQRFAGKKDMERSTKKQFKFVEKKKEILSDDLQMEVDYLEPEMYDILQKVKRKIQSGELEDDDPDAKLTLKMVVKIKGLATKEHRKAYVKTQVKDINSKDQFGTFSSG